MIRWVDSCRTQIDMRDLWDEHVQYTRMVIIDFASNLPELDATSARLLQNQDAIGAAFTQEFGPAVGQQTAKLLREHILGAVKLLKAAKAKSGFDQAKAEWYANADQLAALWASTGRWSYQDLQRLLYTHLDTTITEASAELEGRWADSIAAYDVARAHAR